MNVLDIIFLIPLLYALYRGFKKGIVHMISSLAALVLGIFGAIKLRPVVAGLLDSLFSISPEYMNVIAFAVAFVSIVIVVHLVAYMAEKLVKAVALNLVNRLLGMAFGLLVTAFVLSMILWPINEVNEQKQIIKPERIEGSLLYKPLSEFAPAIFPYLKKEDWKQYVPKKKNKLPVTAQRI
jgi:membrane protein required for colicin V production